MFLARNLGFPTGYGWPDRGHYTAHREWKISGDDELIKTIWEKASKALDFAFEYWDSDGDFVLDSQQHNTYDIEFYGPNSLTNSMFFAALKPEPR